MVERQRRFVRFLTLGVVIVALATMSMTSTGGQQETRPAHAQGCHYSEMATGSEELGLKIAGPSSLLPSQTTMLEFRGPYEGQLSLSPDAHTALGASEAEAVCSGAGQPLNLTKGSGTLALYATNCRDEIGGIAFDVDMADECRRHASPAGRTTFEYSSSEHAIPTTQPSTPEQTAPQCVPAPPANNQQQGQSPASGNPSNSGGGGYNSQQNSQQSSPIKYNMPGAAHDLPADSLADPLTGIERADLAVTGMMADEMGPYHIAVWWESVPGAEHVRVLVEGGNGEFPANGWKVPFWDSVRGRSYSVIIGGEGVAGFAPGTTLTVRVQAVDYHGNYGPPSAPKTVKTYPYRELGAVQNLQVYDPPGGQPGYVRVKWNRAHGQQASIGTRQDSVSVQWRKSNEEYSEARTVGVAWRMGRAHDPFEAYPPRLEHGHTYHFRVTPKRTYMPDGTPAEATITLPPATPPAPPTLTGVRRTSEDKWVIINFKADISFDSVKLHVKSDLLDVTYDIDEERKAYCCLVSTAVNPNDKFCYRIAGVTGEGANALQGEFSEEMCE